MIENHPDKVYILNAEDAKEDDTPEEVALKGWLEWCGSRGKKQEKIRPEEMAIDQKVQNVYDWWTQNKVVSHQSVEKL